MRKFLVAVSSVFFVVPMLFAGDGSIRRNAEPIRDSYLVILKSGDTLAASARATALVNALGGNLGDVWNKALHGFSVKMTEAQAKALSRSQFVASVEEDGYVHVTSTTETVGPSLWDIDRIDQRTLPTDGAYTYCQDGTDVKIYIVDTGIRAGHTEFYPVRVVAGVDFVTPGGGTGESLNPCQPGSWDTQYMNPARVHGTEVASVAGGATLGVAKNAHMVSVKSFDCRGTASRSKIVSGINWVTTDHQAGAPAVMNLSFAAKIQTGVYTSADLDAIEFAVNGAIDDGITVVTGAGNENGYSCTSLVPQRVTRAIVVGGTTQRYYGDERWLEAAQLGSNWGSCVDVWAPGTNIAAAGIDSVTDVQLGQKGTSLSSPMAAGVAAQYLQLHPTATPADVESWIVANATPNVIDESLVSLNGSPNRMLYTFCQ